jgi:multiple antibiotic resistance protein
MLVQTLAAFLLAFPALFSIVNPLGGAIIFNEVTAAQTRPERRALARRVAVYALGVMLTALGAGTYILNFFGISMNALRIAGGLVVAVRAYEMLSAPEVSQDRKQREAAPASAANTANLAGYAFFPLTLPFTTGPGTIAVAVSLGTARPDALAQMGAFYVGVGVAALALAGIVWASYAGADRLVAVLGTTGQQVMARIVAFLLLGIGVQIALNGIVPVLHGALG